MAKFIELHYLDDEAIIVNVDRISLVLDSIDGAVVYLLAHPEATRKILHVKETYQYIKNELAH